MKLTTEELTNKLLNSHGKNISQFISENRDEIMDSANSFGDYFKSLLEKNSISQRDAFIYADIPERYGYKLLSAEKKTRKRDVIIRLCYAGKFSVEETNRCLKLYGMSELYSRISRDALLIVCFNDRPGTLSDVNKILISNNMEPLEEAGNQE